MGNKNSFKAANYVLPIAAAVIVAAAVCITAITKHTETADFDSSESASIQSQQVQSSDGKIRISADSLSEEISFVDYDSAGTAMQFMLLKTSDGIIRSALNTCQICNGSAYAYFVQSGDTVICQNCGNVFSLDQIGEESGGCNPVPLEHSEDGDDVVIDTALLDEYASAFVNWKKGI